tara:strand:- start:86 stop:373 length:288 start_codon:yes stop_codon:yes gene_type:complete
MSEVITSEELSAVRQLGYRENITYCQVFNWFRERWGYVAWIEKSGNKYGYKIYTNGVFLRPKETTKWPYCKNHEEAQVKLLEELIKVVQERESLT